MRLRDIYLYLADNAEVFDPEDAETYAVRDLDIVDVELSKNDEQSFWTAAVKVRNPGGGWYSPTAKTRAIITERDQDTGDILHVITGRLEGWPVGMAGQIVTLKLMAKPSINERIVLEDSAMDGIDDDPWLLFTRAETRRKPEEKLGGSYRALNWRRSDKLQPVLTDLISGTSLVDLEGKWIEGSLQFAQPDRFVTRVNVSLSAEWEEYRLIISDVGSRMTQSGFFGLVTRSNDWKGFPLPGDKIGDWYVVKSNIAPRAAPVGEEHTPEYVSYLKNNIKAKNLKEYGIEADENTLYFKTFKQYFYDLDLLLAGVGKVKRSEKILFSVVWTGDNIASYEGDVETIELSCANMNGRYVAPDWEAGTYYSAGSEVMHDGIIWKCIESHVAGEVVYSDPDQINEYGEIVPAQPRPASIYQDMEYWEQLLVNQYDPIGGVGQRTFFNQPNVISDVGANGNVQSIVARAPTPGFTAMKYAHGQACAKILDSVRSVTATFDVPWPLVRDLQGSERIRIEDADIPGGEMIGKVTSIKASLVSQKATITIASAPGRANPSDPIGLPAYDAPPILGPKIIAAFIENDFIRQNEILAASQAPLRKNLLNELKKNRPKLSVTMGPVPKTGHWEVDIDGLVFGLDTDVMIDLRG